MKVFTVGGAMIDTIVSIADDHIERMTLRNADAAFLLLEVGHKREAENISVHCGGGAINAAVAMARLGHETSILVKLGRDFRSDIILSRLVAEGISTRFVVSDEHAPTGASVLVTAHDHNTAVLTFRGANTLLTVADLDTQALGVDLVYVASLSDKSADCFPAIVAQAKAAGALVAVNPGIRQLSSRQAAFRDALADIDILSINRREAEVLVPWLSEQLPAPVPSPIELLPDNEPVLARRGVGSDGAWLSFEHFFRRLTALGPRWVVVTDGKDGAYIGMPDGVTHCPAPSTEVVGTAGAGDAFNATFAAAIVSGAAIADAAIAAALNSASVVTYLDTQTGLLSGKELAAQIAVARDALLLRHWPYQ